MKRFTKRLIIISMICIVTGGVLGLTGWLMGGRGATLWGIPFGVGGVESSPLGAEAADRMEGGQRNLEAFHSIEMDVSFADIHFETAADYGVALTWYGQRQEMHYRVVDGTLFVEDEYHGQLEYLDQSRAGQVTVYLPAATPLQQVVVDSEAGALTIADLQANGISLNSDFGEMVATNLQATQMEIQLDSGDFKGSGLTAEYLEYENDFGATTFEQCDFGYLTASADSGTITVTDTKLGGGFLAAAVGEILGSNLTAANLGVESDSGLVDLKGTFTGETKIRAGFGEVCLTTTLPKAAYDYDLYTDFGAIVVDGTTLRGSVVYDRNSANGIVVGNDSGSITLNFGRDGSIRTPENPPAGAVPGTPGDQVVPAPLKEQPTPGNQANQNPLKKQGSSTTLDNDFTIQDRGSRLTEPAAPSKGTVAGWRQAACEVTV